MLSYIQSKLGGLVRSDWHDEVDAWGERVELFRRYDEGDHDANLSGEMREMLRINSTTRQTNSRSSGTNGFWNLREQFNPNYCGLVVSTMADRLQVDRIEAVMPRVVNPQGVEQPESINAKRQAQGWADELLSANRFDALQMDVHEACIRDGDTFVVLAWDNDAGRVTMYHEPAYDGDTGMIPVYDRQGRRLIAAAKIWYEAAYQSGRRVNIYYADRVVKYGEMTEPGEDGAMFSPMGEEEVWLPGRVPVVHFRNLQKSRRIYGQSELAAAIPVQDALNRNMVSMVMTAELSAFQIRVAKGFSPPANLAPGMWVEWQTDDASLLSATDAFALEQAQLVPFIDQAQYLIEQIATVTKTPIATVMGGDNQSGEALKQRESGLLGKIKRFQTRAGNAWEDVVSIAAGIQDAYGATNAPRSARWDCKWADAEVRNDAQVIANAVSLVDHIPRKEFYRQVGRVYGWDEAKVTALDEEMNAEAATMLSQMPLPGFDRLATG